MDGILLIVVVILLIINSNRKNEIKKLKQQLYNLYYGNGYYNQYYSQQQTYPQNYNNYVQPSIQYDNSIQYPTQHDNYVQQQYDNNVPKEPKYSNKDIKNTLILITGSVLLILSAILFLATTWDSTNNILKSLVLIIMLCIFCATSHIAEKYLKLKQTSKAFYYIALAYLPIVALSFSVFELFGSYFSITGPGKYVYLALSSIIVTIIYYYNAYKKKEKIVGIASSFFSVISILCICAIFSTDYNYLIFSLIIYGLILAILYKNKIYYLEEGIHSSTIMVLGIAIGIVLIFDSLICLMNSEVIAICIVNNILLLFSLCYYLKYIQANEKTIDFVFPIYLLFISLLFVGIIKVFLYQQLIVLFAFLILYGYDFFRSKTISKLVFALTLCSIIPLVCFSVSNDNGIPCYLIFLFYVMLSYIYYIFNKNNNLFSALIFSVLLVALVFSTIMNNNLPLVYIGYILLGIMILPMFMKKDYKIIESLKYICNLSFLLASFISFKCNISYLVLLLLYIILSFVQCFRYGLTIFKVLAYLYFDALVMILLQYLGFESSNIYMIIYTFIGIILIALEYFVDKLSDRTNEIFVFLNSIVTFILLCCLNNDIYILLMFILFSTLFVWYVYYKKLFDIFAFTPFLFLISFVYFSNISIMYFISFILLVYFAISNYYKKQDRYNVLYFVYAFIHIVSFNEFKYISLLLITVGIFVNYFIRSDKVKDFCKGLLYTCALIFSLLIMYDYKLYNICLIRYLPFMIWLLFITRTIIKKYDIYSCKIIEYIGFIIINFLAFLGYENEADGMLFVFALAIFVMISYTLKFGPVFIVCLISILINVLLLTREFWLSIPWWLYILVIGTILVLFAINNELHQKKKKSFISKIKDKVDL